MVACGIGPWAGGLWSGHFAIELSPFMAHVLHFDKLTSVSRVTTALSSLRLGAGNMNTYRILKGGLHDLCMAFPLRRCGPELVWLFA
ncbi:hypothetical protein VNO77_38934 [Canavalia gladiata]|uniref:Uncharacterized protein n=1 Tax=Canavalia gladiata TaxID=3824 RepID=A0AAN9KBB1_CANGL